MSKRTRKRRKSANSSQMDREIEMQMLNKKHGRKRRQGSSNKKHGGHRYNHMHVTKRRSMRLNSDSDSHSTMSVSSMQDSEH